MLKVENYFEAFIIIFMLGFFLLLIKSFILPLFLAASFVFIFYRPYKKLSSKLKNKTIPALFIIFITITLILLPTYILSIKLVEQTTSLAKNTNQIYQNFNIEECQTVVCDRIKSNINVLDFNIDTLIKKTSQYLLSSSNQIFTSVTKIFINLFIFLLAFFYLLIDGENLMKYIKKLIPMKNEYKEALFVRFRDVTLAVFVDSILVAIIQGTLVGIGFWLFGIKSPIFWGTIAAFFALIPMIGTAIVWMPAALYLIYIKAYIPAILLLLYGAIVVSLSDNFIRPILIKNKIRVHSFLILLSILGGMQLFGFLGIFLGPIIISLLITILQLYKLDFR